MPFLTATREDGATLLVNVDQIQYVVYKDSEGQEEVSIIFDSSAPAQPGAQEITIRGDEARRVWEALSSLLSL